MEKAFAGAGRAARSGERAVEVMALFDGTIVALEHRRPGPAWRDFTVGTEAGVSFALPAEELGAREFALLGASLLGPVVGVPTGARVEIQAAGKLHTIDAWRAIGQAHTDELGVTRMRLPEDGEAVIDIGAVTFRVRFAALSTRLPLSLRLDWSAHRYTAGSFVVAMMMLAMIFAVPPDMKSLSADAFAAEHHWASIVLVPPDEKAPPVVENKKEPGDTGPKGQKARGMSGKAGAKNAPRRNTRLSIKGPTDNPDPHIGRPQMLDLASKMGILGQLHSGNPAIANIFSAQSSTLGRDAENVMGNLIGTEVGSAYGDGGLGFGGGGSGGGGGRGDTVGVGDIGTVGNSIRNGHGPGCYGCSVATNLRRHAAAGPEVTLGEARTVGMDRELVRRVIRRHLNEVKFCYERELGRKPNLYGRVVVQFTIAPAGNVVASGIQSSTLGAPEVDQCIAQAVRRWEFPKPPAGLVMVSYPFVLQHAGSATATEAP